jgi:GAF domain-containing protein
MHFVANPESRSEGTPLACIPMVFGNQTVGVISILDFFEQKQSFEDIDFEFFKLLATHSASAIVAAGLMANADSMGTGLKQYQGL